MRSTRCVKAIAEAGCAAMLPFMWLVSAHAECKLKDIPPTEIGRRGIIERHLTHDESRMTVAPPDARYVRVLMKAEHLSGSGNSILTIRDKYLRPIQVLNESEFVGVNSFWSSRVPGNQVILDLDRRESSVDLKVLGYIAMPEEAQKALYSVENLENPKFRDLHDGSITKSQILGDHVGLVLGSFGVTTWSCSGVLLTERHLLTNWHCGGLDGFGENDFWSDQICRDTLIDMSWDGDQVSREYSCRRVVEKDRDTDFAILELTPVNTTPSLRPARFKDIKPTKGQDVSIIHHPAAKPKQISKCKVQEASHAGWITDGQTDFTYDCDTAGGSSGSPVFNESGHVIGIHHYGYKIQPQDCQVLDHTNKAIKISAVFNRLRQLGHESLLREADIAP